ncbi:MAG: FAD/NAD(P)-binding protein [Deltaproteobacteria bacterium]|nr:FAD/NAD(P)-binding protein [Deltaproteobacteria bacterium]
MVSPYLPSAATVERVTKLTEKERLFTVTPLAAIGGLPVSFDPGQFFMCGLPGYGEAPFSVASMPVNSHINGSPKQSFDLCIRAVGNLSNAMHRIKKGDRVYLRGPFGRGFKTDELKGKDLLFIAGGIGIVPMRSFIKSVAGKDSYGKLTLICGAKTPEEILFQGEMDEWKDMGMDVRLTIDKRHPGWKGNVGVVTTLISSLKLKPDKTVAAIIGPPVMYKFVALALRKKLIKDASMLVSLERRMKCGFGKCGHCQINSSYVCQDGPVYRLTDLAGLPEAF